MNEEIRKALVPIRLEVGAIVQNSQQLELGLKYAISLVKGLESDEYSDDIFSVEFESLSKATLGPLIVKFKKHIEINSEFEDILAKALAERNYVIHNFFTDKIEFLTTPEGRKDELLYLRTAWKAIAAGVIAIDEVVPKLMTAAGMNPAEISEEVKDAIKV